MYYCNCTPNPGLSPSPPPPHTAAKPCKQSDSFWKCSPLPQPPTRICGPESTYCFVHFILQVRFGAEDFVGAGRAQGLYDLGQQEEVVEEEAVQLLVALGLVELPAVQKLAWPQAIGH